MAYRKSRRVSRKAGRRMSRKAGRGSRKVRRSRRVRRGGNQKDPHGHATWLAWPALPTAHLPSN